MSGYVYFGTRDYMTWVPAPAVGLDASTFGWNTQSNYLNGGAYVRTSTSSHKEYQLTWNNTSRDNIRLITDFADRVYGTGLVYWCDPFAMDKNMLPQLWATPSQGIDDGVILSGSTVRPSRISTPTNSLGYPSYSAVYTVASADIKPQLWIPIPTGYTAWVGVHGAAGSGGVVVAQPTTGATTTGSATNLTALPVTSTTRFNYHVDSNNGANTGLLMYMGGTGTITLSGMMVQLLKTGVTPATGGFISGQGNSGCRFATQPTLTEYNAVIGSDGLMALTAKLVEVGSWL